jgi:glycosyltransferase involved in cell wall biosynthesis
LVGSNRYWVCLYTRDGAGTLDETLNSIVNQTVRPAFVVAVDDGSTDRTPEILRHYKNALVIRTNSKTRDIRRAPRLINMAYEEARSLGTPEFCMITGDDCIYPSNYVEALLQLMDSDATMVIASGDWGVKPPPDKIKPPQGSGRIVREWFMIMVGGRYPERYGWESWLLLKAIQLGYKTLNLTDLRYAHARSYSSKQIFNWGRAMWVLGYDPLFVAARIAKNVLFRNEPISLFANLQMLAGYATGPLSEDKYCKPFDSDLRQFVRRSQRTRLSRLLNVARWIRWTR